VNALEAVLTELGIADPCGLQLTGKPRPGALSSRLAAADYAASSVVAYLTTAIRPGAGPHGAGPEFSLDTGHVTAAVRSEALLRDPDSRGLG
jgi:hypothetical protein